MNSQEHQNSLQDTYVDVKIVTWQKDTNELFDYEHKHDEIINYQVFDNNSYFFRQDTKVSLEKQAIMSAEEHQPLCSLKKFCPKENHGQGAEFVVTQLGLDGQERVTKAKSPQKDEEAKEGEEAPKKPTTAQDQTAFMVVRSMKDHKGRQRGFSLKAGDTIRFGRIEYTVVEAFNQHKNKITKIDQANQGNNNDDHYIQNIDKSEQHTCRICLMDESEEGDFFVSPCDCKGSSAWVHFNCLKHWMSHKTNCSKTKAIASLVWKNLECEICKCPLPKKMKVNDVDMDVVELKRPEGCPYLILESNNADKGHGKGLHILCFNEELENQTIKIGRGHKCQMRIPDISVSRIHAFIQYKQGRFIMTDNNSKFGSLVKLNVPWQVTREKIAFQIGRSVITFVLKKRSDLGHGGKPSSKLHSVHQIGAGNLKMKQTVNYNIPEMPAEDDSRLQGHPHRNRNQQYPGYKHQMQGGYEGGRYRQQGPPQYYQKHYEQKFSRQGQQYGYGHGYGGQHPPRGMPYRGMEQQEYRQAFQARGQNQRYGGHQDRRQHRDQRYARR